MTSVLRYPYEALTETTDYLQLTIKSYSGLNDGNNPIAGATFGTNQSAIDVSNTAASALKPAQLSENGVIILPMPSNIEDSNSVSYDGDTLNALAGKAFDVAATAAGTNLLDLNSVLATTEKVGQAMAGVFKDEGTKKLVTQALAAQAVNLFGSNISINSILARTQGKILNPNMELLFNNVTLRTFRFSFKMTPRDEVESLQVKSIIRSLKKNMAAKRVQDSNLFLETPNIFELEYKKGNKLHPFLHRFKQCALSDMSVNYTGENVYATYNDGTPVSLIMNLTFKELVPVYEDDYFDDAFTVNAEGTRIVDNDYENGIPQNRMVYGVTGNQQNDVEGVGY